MLGSGSGEREGEGEALQPAAAAHLAFGPAYLAGSTLSRLQEAGANERQLGRAAGAHSFCSGHQRPAMRLSSPEGHGHPSPRLPCQEVRSPWPELTRSATETPTRSRHDFPAAPEEGSPHLPPTPSPHLLPRARPSPFADINQLGPGGRTQLAILKGPDTVCST